MLLISFLIIILSVAILYKHYNKKFKDIEKLPGPSTFQLLRNLYKASSSKNIVNYILTLNGTYGPVVKIWMKPFPPAIIVTDMEYVNKIYKDRQHFFSPSMLQLTFLQDGIATNPDFATYQHDKREINKVIKADYITKMLTLCSKKFDNLIKKIAEQKKVDLENDVHDILSEVMIESFQHLQVDLKREDIVQYCNARKEFFKHLLEKMNSLYMPIFHIFSKNYRLSNQCRDIIVNFTTNWFQQFKEIDGHLRNNENMVFSMLNSGMPETRVIANINTIIQAGQDTMGLPLAFTFREISRQPYIQKKIREEINDIFGNDISAISLSDLDKMTYTHAVLKESLRMHLPLPLIERKLRTDVQIVPGDTKLPKGMIVMFHLSEILRSPEFYPNPHTFNPERFVNDSAVQSEKAFVAFGYHLKSCPGKKLSFAVMKLLIVKLFKEFEMDKLDDTHEPEILTELFYRSANGVPAVFKKRENK